MLRRLALSRRAGAKFVSVDAHTGLKLLTPQEVADLVDEGHVHSQGTVILDVRDRAEYALAELRFDGVLQTPFSVWYSPAAQMCCGNTFEDVQEVLEGFDPSVANDVSAPVIVMSHNQKRAMWVARRMQQAGWEDVSVMEGGIRRWNDELEYVGEYTPFTPDQTAVGQFPRHIDDTGDENAGFDWEEVVNDLSAQDEAARQTNGFEINSPDDAPHIINASAKTPDEVLASMSAQKKAEYQLRQRHEMLTYEIQKFHDMIREFEKNPAPSLAEMKNYERNKRLLESKVQELQALTGDVERDTGKSLRHLTQQSATETAPSGAREPLPQETEDEVVRRLLYLQSEGMLNIRGIVSSLPLAFEELRVMSKGVLPDLLPMRVPDDVTLAQALRYKPRGFHKVHAALVKFWKRSLSDPHGAMRKPARPILQKLYRKTLDLILGATLPKQLMRLATELSHALPDVQSFSEAQLRHYVRLLQVNADTKKLCFRRLNDEIQREIGVRFDTILLDWERLSYAELLDKADEMAEVLYQRRVLLGDDDELIIATPEQIQQVREDAEMEFKEFKKSDYYTALFGRVRVPKPSTKPE